MWEKSFADFAAGWNYNWSYFLQHSKCLCMCQFVAQQHFFCDIFMDRGTSILCSCCQANELWADQGMLVRDLFSFMCETHNHMVGTVDQTMLLANRHEHRGPIQRPVIQLAECLPAHMLEYDYEGSFMPLIKNECVQVNLGGGVD